MFHDPMCHVFLNEAAQTDVSDILRYRHAYGIDGVKRLESYVGLSEADKSYYAAFKETQPGEPE